MQQIMSSILSFIQVFFSILFLVQVIFSIRDTSALYSTDRLAFDSTTPNDIPGVVFTVWIV